MTDGRHAFADVYPRHHPERADLVEGSIGELSPFHETYGEEQRGRISRQIEADFAA